jgi:hypothetical protein
MCRWEFQIVSDCALDPLGFEVSVLMFGPPPVGHPRHPLNWAGAFGRALTPFGAFNPLKINWRIP